MSTIEVGTKIKATKGQSVLVGEVVEVDNRTDYLLDIHDDVDSIWIESERGWEIEIIESVLPTHGNAVVYSQEAWAVARRASDGSDKWFPDNGAWPRSPSLTTEEMLEWTKDWEVLR